ncbi:MAG: MBL fold metallo-hydrolase [Cyanobacteria bacterium P01_H01_bin.121]
MLDNLFAFPPNRETLGGTAYFIVRNEGNVLIDCPGWNEIQQRTYQSFLESQGGVRWLLITHRSNIGRAKQVQRALHCPIVIQEQEAYLLPKLDLITFETEIQLTTDLRGIWTCGHSPGSTCFYWQPHGGVLFTGRHLLPDRNGQPAPLRTAKTFHWPRQLRNVTALRQRFSTETLHHICPGASIGLLRGRHTIEAAYTQLNQLDLDQLATTLS